MRIASKILKRHYFSKFLIYFLSWCMVVNTFLPAAIALEAIDVTGSTGLMDATWGDHTIIDTDHGAIIDWKSFNTSSTQSITFNQHLGGELSSLSAVLNRVNSGAVPTQFDGALNANGRVFVVNPAGVIFGAGATVNVSQLVASGLNMSDDAFDAILADPAALMAFQGGEGEVRNLGSISAGSVYLIGKKVVNLGSIMAPDGLVVMAAGDNVYLGQDGSNVVVELDSDPGGLVADVRNEGSISADNGKIVLAAGDRFSRAVENAGTLAASAGTVTIDAARVDNSGVINTDSGGSVNLIGSEAVVLNGGGDITAGAVMIEGPQLTVADGYAPAEASDNTLYEKWVEQQLQDGTDLELVAGSRLHGSIVVENISDGEITGGSGDLALRTKYDTGGITFLPELEAGPITTTIHTTDGGNVYMLAGEGGITIGDVHTEVPSSDKLTEPGKIRLFTNNYGDIETGELTVEGGSYDEVSIIASGDLTINGSVSTITNQVPSDVKEIGQARTCLVSEHGDVVVEGGIVVRAHGKITSTADIHIDAGQNITLNLGTEQRIDASSHTSENGPAEASVRIHAGKDIDGPGVISINGGGKNPVHVLAKSGGGAGTAEVYSTDDEASWDETDGEAHALLEIDEDRTVECPDCPTPPDLPPPLPPITAPDTATTHMGDPVGGNVLDNDSLPQGGTLTAILMTEPKHGELTEFDFETGQYTYQPDEGYVGTDTFTYIASDGELFAEPITVTINVTNTLVVAEGESSTTHMGVSVHGTIQDNVSDPDGDPFTTALVTDAEHGILTLNPDGTYSYEPEAGYVGPDGFTYSAVDGQTGAEPTEATVAINMINALPNLGDDTATTEQDVAVAINVLANDLDPDGDTISVANFLYEGTGTLVLNADGTFTYTPGDGFSGEDSFTYSAADPQVGAQLAHANVTITVNQKPAPAVPTSIAAVPGLERVEFGISGCPALIKWTAAELDVEGSTMQIWAANTLASSREIQPCDACAKLKTAAMILQDNSGVRSAALAQVIGEFSSGMLPLSEEQDSSIMAAIANDYNTNSHYAMAGEYLDSLALYVGTLSNELNFSAIDSVMFASDRYIAPLTEGESDNAGLATFLAARLADLSAL